MAYCYRADARRDRNEGEIVRAMRRCGARVVLLDEPVDLLVGYKGRTILLEVKLPLGPKGGTRGSELNDKQQRFFDMWRGGEIYVVRSVSEAFEVLGVEVYQ